MTTLKIRGDSRVRRFPSPHHLDSWLRYHGATAEETSTGSNNYQGRYLPTRHCSDDCSECRA